MDKFIKHQLKKRFGDLIASYHYYKSKKLYNRMWPKQSGYGFNFIGGENMQSGLFEPEETAFVSTALQTTDVFVDVGANIGYYTCISRHKAIHTIAVEPLAENLIILYANLGINGWADVEVFPLGLAEKPGIANLYGGNTAASLIRRWAGSSELLSRTAALSTLDVILGQRFADKRLLIKIDVEGSELQLLRGAPHTLVMRPKPTWIIEICLTENQPSGPNKNFLDTFKLFWENKYEAFVIDKEIKAVTPKEVQGWVLNPARRSGSSNFLFKEKNQ